MVLRWRQRSCRHFVQGNSDHLHMLVLRFPPEQKCGCVWWRHTSFFSVWSLLQQPTSVWECWCEIGCCESIHYHGVPRKTLAVLPGNEGKAIRSFPVVSKQPSWFFCGRNVGPFERSPNEIIDLMVARRSSSAQLTRHAVCVSGAHCCATRTNVHFTEVKAKTQPNCDTNGLVAYTKTAWWDE